MSKIDKLSILGVRSFGHEQPVVIQFYTPLTLIVGYNGSGKTTIIECLKYATTGELPPNSKTQGAFIHDPKLCGEKEVMAQVRLSFKSTSGIRMSATRSLQVTVKKTTRTQKTLDAHLLMVKDGERTAISSRVAELDQILPQYLGVSKAILEFVIFCHQDDSLWPMSEPSVLKKKFDEIFEALKYTKAIENIKILRKKQNEELGKLKILEQHAKEAKAKGERAENRMVELYDEIEIFRAQTDDLELKIADAARKSQDAFNHAAKFEQIVAQLNGKRIELRAVNNNFAELQQNLREMTDSDSELQSILDQYEERIAQYQEEREVLRQQYSSLSNELDGNRRSLGLKQSEVGKFEAQKDQHERHLKQRETLIKETARHHGVRGYDLDITDSHIAQFMVEIRKKSKDANKVLEKAHQETQEELKQAQLVLNQLNERKSAMNQSKEMARSQIATNDKRMTTFQLQMDAIEIDEGGEAVLIDGREDTQRRLSKAIAEANEAKLDTKIEEAESKIRVLDTKKDKLEAEQMDATRLARDFAQIEYLQKQFRDTQHGLDTMTKTYGEQITKIVGPHWEPSSLDATYQSAVKQKATEVKDAEFQREGTMRALDKINDRIFAVENDRKKKLRQLQDYEKTVQKALGEDDDVDNFEEALQQLEQDYELATTDRSKFSTVVEYFQQCLQIAKENNECRLCRRHLKDDRSFSKANFVSTIERQIEKMSRNADETNVDEIQSELETMRNAKPSFDALNRLKTDEIPALDSEAQKLKSGRQNLNDELSRQDIVVRDYEDSKREVESVAKSVQAIAKHYSDSLNHEKDIKNMTAKQQAAGGSRGLDTIQEELKNLSEESRVVKATLTRLSADKERSRNLVNGLELKIRDINAELSTAQSKLKEKRALAERIDELKSYNSEQRDTMRRLDRDVQEVAPAIEQAQVRYDDSNRRGNERIQTAQEENAKLSDSVRQLEFADQEIKAYIDRGGPRQLLQTREAIENLEAEVARLEQELRQVTIQVKKIEDSLHNTDDTKRAIKDNLRYRRAKRDLRTLQTEIEELETNNAEADKDRYEREGGKWQHERNRLTTQQAGLFATMKSKDEQLSEMKQEFDMEYQDAAKQYREAHIKVETTKAAVEDLGRYGGALDKAIMKYHTLKMEEINRIIEELWQKTYQGTDVDSICIRSDNETAKGNRSYNYRVVMIKQDAEMDMRGRCSAGQKVLASIIIRLALAECFGVNCGLIALDEPTTNLDQSNIRALAESLSEIIKIRRKQANFQLIVITHDEEFLRHMQCADFCDQYFRVSRDPFQKSIIERQSIHEVA